MKCCIVRKAPYRLPGTSRLVWSLVLLEREGLALLFVKKPNESDPHAIVIAAENVAERCFEDVPANRFNIEQGDIVELANKLNALGDGLAEDEIEQFFKSEGLW